MEIKASDVKELRDLTGAGMMEAKNALIESKGDVEAAKEWLRKHGATVAEKKSARNAGEGIVASYVHTNSKVAVLVELNCETDFVAKNEDFKTLAREIALQVAGMKPQYIERTDVPAEIVEAKKAEWKSDVEGKPADVADKILTGKLEKYFQEVCLMEQSYFKDEDRTVRDLLNELVGTIKENMRVSHFVRFEVGEEPVTAHSHSNPIATEE